MKKVIFLILATFFATLNVSALQNYSCNYYFQNHHLDIYYNDGKDLTFIYPDNTKKVLDSPTLSEIALYQSCPDIFYNSNTHEIIINRVEDISSCAEDLQCLNFFNELYAQKEYLNYYCKNANCNYPKNKSINWEVTNNNSNLNNDPLSGVCKTEGVAKALRFVGRILFVVKILIPIILIIMGIIDFGKAMISDDSDSIKKATSVFIRRLIASVIIFFIPTIINYIFGVVVKTPKFQQYENCKICIFKPNDCVINN